MTNLFSKTVCLNAEVEVISAEARNTLLVPLQALRELGPDQYAVFVVQPDGELELRDFFLQSGNVVLSQPNSSHVADEDDLLEEELQGEDVELMEEADATE